MSLESIDIHSTSGNGMLEDISFFFGTNRPVDRDIPGSSVDGSEFRGYRGKRDVRCCVIYGITSMNFVFMQMDEFVNLSPVFKG